MTMAPRFRENFECTPTEASRARRAVSSFVEDWLAQEDRMDFSLAVGEALANAVEHGKCSHLSIDCRYARNRVVCEIEQDGIGFMPPQLPTMPKRSALRGYGIFIMKHTVDKVEYRQGGKLVRLVKTAKS